MYIIFEGSDGVGKSTQIQLLAAKLREISGKKILCTHEPTDGKWGKLIKEKTATLPLPDVHSLAVWFSRDRHDHLLSVVCPAIEEENIVLQDRYYLSTLVYQGETPELRDMIARHSFLFCIEPTLWIILERRLDKAIKSVGLRGAVDGFEQQPELQQRVRDSYVSVAGKYCIAPVIIEHVVEGDAQATHERIWEKFQQLNILE